MKQKIYQFLPHFFQNSLITLFNFISYRERYGGNYSKYLKAFRNNRFLTLEELKQIQQDKFIKFLEQVVNSSQFYKDYSLLEIDQIIDYPIINKETLRKQIANVYTLKKTEGIISKTGGTTGKSLEVIFTRDNMQERFAMLDDFRNKFGYKLGKKTAWFSGKNLLTQRDIKKFRFWKTDWYHNIRYYSTFHIKDNYLKYYVEDLIRYQPEYFVGFPSTILEVAKYGLKNGYKYPKGVTKAIFPTAETVTVEMRKVIETFFQTKMFNQYASSEGAPFIFECEQGRLHLELQSGIFEVLDENNKPSRSGKLVITSFSTLGTPLIRYDIGDSIALEEEDKICGCGNNNPLVKEILGRVDDFIYSPANGKINLGNISNTLKDTLGIIRFQVIQNTMNSLKILVVKDEQQYSDSVEDTFIKNWRERVGFEMNIEIEYVAVIPVESSGKYRMVKNNIKHLIT